ncbi:hypothetical protein GCM10010298_07210 [Streptomyces microflavus]|uniref:Uncharacterized protein n=1 Tax=Streptomyces microflavus TaxID=1919 RepID=A0A7J0CM12_STRMI|nr:hypothetical protein Smic_20980 [Streptomyces microflavus]GGX46371.1 hypothetical protein GCM10010298_07210 [Streptomyces microflavus]
MPVALPESPESPQAVAETSTVQDSRSATSSRRSGTERVTAASRQGASRGVTNLGTPGQTRPAPQGPPPGTAIRVSLWVKR